MSLGDGGKIAKRTWSLMRGNNARTISEQMQERLPGDGMKKEQSLLTMVEAGKKSDG